MRHGSASGAGGFRQDGAHRGLLPLFAARGTSLAIVTNDLVTREDAERLQRSGLIPPERVVGVEAGACPHTVIREDPTLNIEAADLLEEQLRPPRPHPDRERWRQPRLHLLPDLVDYWLFVIDVSGGGDIPRKRGPGIIRADLLIINKSDLAPHVGVDLALMREEAEEVRAGRPVLVTNCRTGEGLDRVADHLAHDVLMEG